MGGALIYTFYFLVQHWPVFVLRLFPARACAGQLAHLLCASQDQVQDCAHLDLAPDSGSQAHFDPREHQLARCVLLRIGAAS